MEIQIGYDIRFDIPHVVPVVALLEVHPSQRTQLRASDQMRVEPALPVERFTDAFGNRNCRFFAPRGSLRLWNSCLIEVSSEPDPEYPGASQLNPAHLRVDKLPFLLSSRYCEVDLLSGFAWQRFGNIAPGWPRVNAVCDWVHQEVRFDYEFACPTRTAAGVLSERKGVCRDFQHLAITLCRCLHIPARYATGYLGDIGVPPAPFAMDFNAWFEVFLGDRWWTFDARHREPRIGRVLIARGRDAADVALTTSFGQATLTHFEVTTEQVHTRGGGESLRC